MKKAVCVFMAISLSVLSACSFIPVKGEELINNAQGKYAALDSAQVIIKNSKTDEIEQTFTFKYDEKGVLEYLYTGKSDGENYTEYNNGEKMYIKKGEELTILDKGEDGFLSYDSDNRHPSSTAQMIMFQKKAVKDSSLTVENGITIVKHIYDVKSFKSNDTSEGEITQFDITYRFDSEGNLIDLEQRSVLKKDNNESESTYIIEITKQNEAFDIENTTEN